MKKQLSTALLMKCKELQDAQETSLKAYEIAFQEVIESICPYESWWNVTDCNIFMHLMEHRDPLKTVIAIVKGLNDEYLSK
jgi:hypothetical protein